MHILIKKNYLVYGNYRVKCAIGKRGIGIKKKEGDLITPKGSFKIVQIFYRRDRIGDLITNIPKKNIKKNMGWCDDPKSNKYNQLIRYPFNFNSEKLHRADNIYDIILVLSYNLKPIIKNKGSAIFIHIANKRFSSTEGCVALKKEQLIKIVGKLKRKDKVIII